MTAAAVDRLWRMVARYQDACAVQVRDDPESLARYVEPPSRALLATLAGQDAGCVLLRPLPTQARASELKRLFVEPEQRGHGVARALVETLLADAAELGYACVYLDTAADMTDAQALYERLGFRDCPPYNDNPQASRFMRLTLEPTR